MRDVIYIDDFIDAMLSAAVKIDSYDPINVGSGKGFSVREILDTLLVIVDHRRARIVYDQSKPSMIPIMLVGTRKAESVLGFRARTSLRQGLEKTMNWYRESHLRLQEKQYS